LPYEIDGVVLKIDNRAEGDKLPPKRATPGYARVHKPIPWISGEETVVLDITIQVGRTGVLTPVAELRPVFVQGSTLSRATLHNADEIRLKDIRIGDTVLVRKAGMVIPEVVEVCRDKRKPGTEPFNFIAHLQNKCPACGGVIIKQKVSAGNKEEAAWRCDNIAGCPAQRARSIAFFTQRSALDITGVGGVVAEKLAESGLVKDAVDLFDLESGQLASLNLGTKEAPRLFGEKNATKVREALDRSRSLPLSRWLHALGIPDVGEKIAYELSRLHRDFGDLAGSDLLLAITVLREAQVAHQGLKKRSGNDPLARDSELAIARSRVEEAEGALHSAFQRRLQHNPVLMRQADQEKARLEAEIATLAEQAARPSDAEQRSRHKSRIRSREKRLGNVGLSEEISYGVARNILDFFSSGSGKFFLSSLARSGINPAGEPGSANLTRVSDEVTGKSFVLTGALESLSRDEATALIRQRGGEVVGGVSKSTDFLVVGRDPGSNKLRDAEKHGIAQIDEPKLVQMLGAGEQKRRAGSPRQPELF
jgi:DNA ligase (NAD+)